MIVHNLESRTDGNAQELQALYTGLIGGTALYEVDLWDRHDEAWGKVPAFQISQGSVTGTFTREDVRFAMGARTAALSVAANVRTPQDTEQRLELFLRGNKPAFSIRALVEEEPTLRIEPTRPG